MQLQNIFAMKRCYESTETQLQMDEVLEASIEAQQLK